MSLVGELLVIVALVLVNAVFAGAEIAVIASRKARLKQLMDEGSRSAARVLALKADPERLFATVQIAISVSGAAAGAYGGATFAEHIEPLIIPLPWFGGHAEGVSIAVVVIIVAYLSIVLGELVPKSLALKRAEAYALLVGRMLWSLSSIARPVVWFLTGSSNLLLRPLGDRTTFGEARVSAEELQEMVEDASKAGTVDLHVGEIASRALELADLTAKDVMVPRDQIDAIPLEAGLEPLKRLLLEDGHSRMPVYQGTLDNVVGYLMAKDAIGLLLDGQLVILQDIMRPAYFVPESMQARHILRELQRRRTQLAIVVDEHGAVVGLLTLGDILEELVGELLSEDEAPEELIRREGSGAVVRGHAPVREVNRALDLELPAGEGWSTLAGLCMHLTGGVPQPGAEISVEGVALLEVLEASPRVVRLVRAKPVAQLA